MATKTETVTAVAARSFKNEGASYAKGENITGLPIDQFRDWEKAGLVKPATAAAAKAVAADAKS